MKLSVLQWNVWFRENADNILELIKEADADVVCLQELTQRSTVNPLRDMPSEIETLGYHTYYEPTLVRNGRESIIMGNGIFSKFPIMNRRKVYVQHEDLASSNFFKENRVYIEASVQINNKTLTVGTVHLSYVSEINPSDAQQQELDKLLAAIRPNKHKFILTGDMNSQPDSYTVEMLSKVLRHAGPAYSTNTWTTKPAYDGFAATALDRRLDYVFTTDDIAVITSGTITTEFSDHLPILLEVKV